MKPVVILLFLILLIQGEVSGDIAVGIAPDSPGLQMPDDITGYSMPLLALILLGAAGAVIMKRKIR
ncbi:MAG: hypothetical protein HY364_01250 [Candidatus Aenigmarchaeota archaeon]|nr:hypothetical protein [Candidatus Aenigmarchaeota archaeon]